MSSYKKETQHPLTGKVEKANWLDDYFGSHKYGVHFPSDDKVFMASEFQWETYYDEDGMTEVAKVSDIPKKVTVAMYDKGKRTLETKHEDGRQDVRVEVLRLDIKERTPEDTAAEGEILKTLNNTKVGVLVVHKPTNHNIYFTSTLAKVRENALMVIDKYSQQYPETLIDLKDFILIESAVVNEKPKVTTL